MTIRLLKTDDVIRYNGFKVGHIYPVVHKSEIFNSKEGMRKCYLIRHRQQGKKTRFLTVYSYEFEVIHSTKQYERN